MTEEQAINVIVQARARVAPDVAPDEVRPETLLQDDLELDSMDFLNLVGAVCEATGIDVPELDYPRLTTVGGFAAYLAAASATASTG